MAKALDMPLPERRERWQSAFDVISRHDVYHWSKSFIAELEHFMQAPSGSSGGPVAAESGSLA
jgi:trehalose 6-phosphate synthase